MLVIGVALAQLLEGLASSSSFERPMPAPPIAVTASSLPRGMNSHLVFLEWCFEFELGVVCGLGPVGLLLLYGFRPVSH
jgi:hypothetical protein